MVKSIIHVNGHHIRANRKDGRRRPVFTVKDYKRNRIGNSVVIDGPSALVYGTGLGNHHGAAAWIETTAKVTVR